MNKYYGLSDIIPQNNKFVVFEGFFDDGTLFESFFIFHSFIFNIEVKQIHTFILYLIFNKKGKIIIIVTFYI